MAHLKVNVPCVTVEALSEQFWCRTLSRGYASTDAAAEALLGILKKVYSQGGRDEVRAFLHGIKAQLKNTAAAAAAAPALGPHVFGVAAALGVAAERLRQFSPVKGHDKLGAVVLEELRLRLFRIITGDTFAADTAVRRHALDCCFNGMMQEEEAKQRCAQRLAEQQQQQRPLTTTSASSYMSSFSASASSPQPPQQQQQQQQNQLQKRTKHQALHKALGFTRGVTERVTEKFGERFGEKMGEKMKRSSLSGPDVGSWTGLWGSLMESMLGHQAMPLLQSVLLDLYTAGQLTAPGSPSGSTASTPTTACKLTPTTPTSPVHRRGPPSSARRLPSGDDAVSHCSSDRGSFTAASTPSAAVADSSVLVSELPPAQLPPEQHSSERGSYAAASTLAASSATEVSAVAAFSVSALPPGQTPPMQHSSGGNDAPALCRNSSGSSSGGGASSGECSGSGCAATVKGRFAAAAVGARARIARLTDDEPQEAEGPAAAAVPSHPVEEPLARQLLVDQESNLGPAYFHTTWSAEEGWAPGTPAAPSGVHGTTPVQGALASRDLGSDPDCCCDLATLDFGPSEEQPPLSAPISTPTVIPKSWVQFGCDCARSSPSGRLQLNASSCAAGASSCPAASLREAAASQQGAAAAADVVLPRGPCHHRRSSSGTLRCWEDEEPAVWEVEQEGMERGEAAAAALS